MFNLRLSRLQDVRRAIESIECDVIKLRKFSTTECLVRELNRAVSDSRALTPSEAAGAIHLCARLFKSKKSGDGAKAALTEVVRLSLNKVDSSVPFQPEELRRMLWGAALTVQPSIPIGSASISHVLSDPRVSDKDLMLSLWSLARIPSCHATFESVFGSIPDSRLESLPPDDITMLFRSFALIGDNSN